jgi:pimeloyl-ACP methyl ester carboxylesterase
MNRHLALGLGAIVAAAAVGTTVLPGVRGDSVDDPATARCNAPVVKYGDPTNYRDRTEVAVHFTCMGSELAGTLAVPPGDGPYPAAVWVHGSGEAGRLTYSGAPLVQALVDDGVAVLSYDKRGVGESEGECCAGDSGHFNVLAADAAGALKALAARPEIDKSRVGFIGASQAGWVVPLAASRVDLPVAFIALVDAPVVSYGQEHLYSHLTGEEGDQPSDLPASAILKQVREAAPSGFDPTAAINQLACPGLWLYGGKDRSQPTDEDVRVLARLRAGHDFRSIVFPNADHGLLDVPPSDPRALPVFVRWIQHVASTSA